MSPTNYPVTWSSHVSVYVVYDNNKMWKTSQFVACKWPYKTMCSKKNPGGAEILRTRRDWSWGPPSLLYDGYRVSLPGVKRPERGVENLPPSSAEVIEE